MNMKLFERILLGIIRKPIKTLILFIVLFVIINMMTASFMIYNSTQTMVDDIKNVIEPIVMIERPSTKSDFHFNFSEFNLERDEKNLKTEELMRAYDEIVSLPEIEYYDITGNGFLYLEEMRNIKTLNNSIFLYDDNNQYYFDFFAVNNANSYYFDKGYFKIIDGRNLTQEEIDNGENKIVVHRSVSIERDGKQSLAQVGDKITLGTRILSERFEDTEYFENFDYSPNSYSRYNKEYLKVLVDNPTVEFEIVGIFDEIIPTNLNTFPKGTLPYKTYRNILSDYIQRVNELENKGNIHKYDKYGEYQFNNITSSNAYSIFILKNQDDIKEFKNKVDEIMTQHGFNEYEFTYSNDAYLKVIGPLESLNSVSSFILIFGIVVGVILLGLISIIFIRERKHEIGILLTLGETKKKIIKQLMLEMLLIGLLAIVTTVFTSKYLINGIQENALANYEQSVQLNENDEVMLGDMSTKEISDKYEELLETSDSLLITIVSATSMMLVCYGSMFIILKMNPKDILM